MTILTILAALLTGAAVFAQGFDDGPSVTWKVTSDLHTQGTKWVPCS